MARRALPLGLQAYLAQISRIPLLTAREERELGWRIINDNDERAKTDLITANLRLVVSISKQFRQRRLAMSDLISEGNTGLILAAGRYDPARGARFSTYATWWIREAVQRALISQAQPVRVPEYMAELIKRRDRAALTLHQELGRAPTMEELAEAMQMPVNRLASISRAQRSLLPAMAYAPRGDDDIEFSDATDRCPDARATLPSMVCERQDSVQCVMKHVDALNERDARVFRLRFGIGGQDPLTLREIGDELGVTRERVRQIEARVLQRIREAMRQTMDDELVGASAGDTPGGLDMLVD